MENQLVHVSENFKKMATRAILSIILFVITYLLLVALAIGLTILCAYWAYQLVMIKPSFLTILAGFGLASVGILVLIFLLKFLFKKHKVDRSHLVEIKEQDQPELFSAIRQIVEDVKTQFPQKVYLSAEVNAAVFYNSSFWSMFFPVKKNLMIGMGLVNSTSVSEFKAILAHEFGHFSQRSMKVGSYVYHVNKIIHNLLFDNESYGYLASGWANITQFFAIFVGMAVKIVHGIQWLLQKMYGVVNLNYMSLSREMEFHADAVAAHAIGAKPLVNSLLRMNLADHALNVVLHYYHEKITDSVKTQNIFPQQYFVMDFLAKETHVPIQNELPFVNLDYLSRFNKSKLVVKNQWASHPATGERIGALKKLEIPDHTENSQRANSLFRNLDIVQAMVTEKLFSAVSYPGETREQAYEAFVKEYQKEYKKNAYDSLFNEYYDNKNPQPFEIAQAVEDANSAELPDIQDLFANEVVDLTYQILALEGDIETMKAIIKGDIKVKTFDYDGLKYKAKSAAKVGAQMEKELSEVKKKLLEQDIKIFQYFYLLAKEQGKAEEFRKRYEELLEYEESFESKSKVFVDIIQRTHFMQEVTPYQAIEENLKWLEPFEQKLKSYMAEMLELDIYRSTLTDDAQQAFDKYLSKKWEYFRNPNYVEAALEVFSEAMKQYEYMLTHTFVNMKKALLEFKVQLEKGKD